MRIMISLLFGTVCCKHDLTAIPNGRVGLGQGSLASMEVFDELPYRKKKFSDHENLELIHYFVKICVS